MQNLRCLGSCDKICCIFILARNVVRPAVGIMDRCVHMGVSVLAHSQYTHNYHRKASVLLPRCNETQVWSLSTASSFNNFKLHMDRLCIKQAISSSLINGLLMSIEAISISGMSCCSVQLRRICLSVADLQVYAEISTAVFSQPTWPPMGAKHMPYPIGQCASTVPVA